MMRTFDVSPIRLFKQTRFTSEMLLDGRQIAKSLSSGHAVGMRARPKQSPGVWEGWDAGFPASMLSILCRFHGLLCPGRCQVFSYVEQGNRPYSQGSVSRDGVDELFGDNALIEAQMPKTAFMVSDIPIMTSMAIPFEFWTENLLSAARDLADAEHQEQRWLAVDAAAWERPAELICVLMDDMNFELYIEENRLALNEEQISSATSLAQSAADFDVGPDGWRDPRAVLSDPSWKRLRCHARRFIASFDTNRE
jgi:hypothetical protein